MINLQLQNQIKEYALKNIPFESCGLLLSNDLDYKFFPCKNISYHKENFCVLDPMDYILASGHGKIVAHVHSQLNEKPSVTDYFNASNHNIYSIVYCWKSDKFYFIEPKLKDYLDKDFQIGKYDCLQLVRNYYKEELNININNYERNDNWFKSNPKIIYENFLKEGFRKISGLNNTKLHDVLLFGKNEERIQHMGIYLENNSILHHPRVAKSCIEYINDGYKKQIIIIVRHKNYE